MSLTIGQIVDEIFGQDAPFRLRAYDGSASANTAARPLSGRSPQARIAA